jgi:hypothetical protein
MRVGDVKLVRGMGFLRVVALEGEMAECVVDDYGQMFHEAGAHVRVAVAELLAA